MNAGITGWSEAGADISVRNEVGRKLIGLESKGKQFRARDLVTEEGELVEGFEEWHGQIFLSFFLSTPMLFLESSIWALTVSFSEVSLAVCCVCRDLAMMSLGYCYNLHHLIVPLHSHSHLFVCLFLLVEKEAFTSSPLPQDLFITLCILQLLNPI